MEEFRSKLKTRIILCSILTVVLVVALITLQSLERRGTIHGETNIGFFAGGIIILIMNILRMKKALKDEKSFKDWYIRNTDERAVAVQLRAANFTSLFTIVLLGIATIVFSYINNVAYAVLAAALGIYMFIYLGSLIYFNKKM
ncbi:hypothetical protein [Ruminococcus flavefaciens]|uniref:hypothetical protein n=1 Tax=Ruminococcus flavefaciens TaxID=1265 RepID=UPI000491E22D|nr:hypothetical protein [Ruminococcus flavefaciens]